jgi:hypothetical protein
MSPAKGSGDPPARDSRRSRGISYQRYARKRISAAIAAADRDSSGAFTASEQWQDVAVPSAVPVVSRRRILAGGAALAAVGVVASACGSPPPPPNVDDLESQVKAARHDSELAAAAAAGAQAPQMAAALQEVAAERSRHAAELETEIQRVIGRATTTSSASSSPTTSAAAAPPPSLADVVNSLRASADSATGLAIASSGYRAGLLASIAAACTAAYTVALVPKGSTP